MHLETSGEEMVPHHRNRVIPFLLVVGVCLAAGLLLGSVAGGIFLPQAAAGQPSTSFTLLGYDSLQPPTTLRAIWVVVLDGEGKAEYMGISPATVILTTDGQAAVLRDFLADPAGAPARLFQVGKIPEPSTAVEFDRQGFIMIVNRMGGIRMEGRTYRGQEILSLLEMEIDPMEQLRLQSRIITALFGVTGPCPSEAALAGLHPAHLLSNYPPEMLIAECTKRGPYLSGSVTVDILDDVMPLDLPDGSRGYWPKE
jgi:hypothetical protein